MYKLLILVFLGLKTQGQQVTLTCPDSWTLIGTSCYSLFSSDQNRIWESAEGVCLNQGSHLASVRDIYENNEIGRFASNKNVTEYWIGLSTEPSVTADDAHWSNGKNWSLLQGFWADMQPDTSRGKCVYVQKQSMDYTYDRVYAWNVGDCNVKRSFICQRMASPSGSYNCANGGYVSSRWLCDGEGDCSDLSDEISCSNICRYLLKASSGTISSEGYPNNYTNARFCSWNIEGPLGTNIFLEFKNFQTEARSDIVKIFVGGRTESTSVEVASLSGSDNVTKTKYLSPNNYMIIQFSTDSAVAKQGFTASYSSISDGAPLVSEITVTDSAQFLQPFTYIFSGQNFYLGNRDYIWKLTAASPRAIITVKIMTLDLKGSDAIFFYDGDSSSASMLVKLCENCYNPGIIFSTSDKLYIIMKSGMGLKGSGFNFTMIQGCNIQMTDSYGMFFSPGYGMVNYANGQTCTWTIQTTPELPILVYFADGAEIEDGVDILQVFTNATNEVSGVAEHFPNQGFGTSELQHRKFVSVNGKVLIKFITNPIINKKGFIAFYSQDCPDPQFSNGTLVTPVAANYPPGSTHRYKDEVDVTCKTGYRFYQESIPAKAAVRLKCFYKGEFDLYQVPNCQPYYCGEPPAVKFGYIIGIDGVTFQSKANYSCYPGYSFQNKSQIICQDGGWETAPICVAAKCIARPLSIASGTGTLRQGDGTSVGTIIDYICNAGYQIQGSSILLCGPNGNWSSATPTCIKLNCPLPRVKNGNFTVTSFPQLGDARTLQCGSGYRANMTTFICTENRTLSAVPVCQNIDECREGTHQCRSPAACHDTDGSYYCTCPNGYYLDTNGKACLDIKECDVKKGYCDDVCIEQSGSYLCTCARDGYTLFTADGTANYTIPTSESGTLNTDTFYLAHTCVRVSCPKPPEIANGTLLTNRQFNHYGDVIEYQCKLGYIPRRATLRCDKTGQWSPSTPNCQRATCPSESPGTLNNPANSSSGPYEYGNQLTLQCNVPGRGIFNKTRQCLYNRDSDNYSLYGNQYECGVIDCGSPEQVAGSNFVVPQSTRFGSSFSFVCGNLYTKQGNSSAGDSIVRCGNDSYWDFGSLQCVGTSCPDPGYPLGGRQVATSYAQNSIVTFTCDRSGFSLNRSTGIQCVLNTQGNGLVWNDSVPQCVDTEKPVFTNCLNPVNFIKKYQQVRPLLPTTLQETDNGGGMKMQTISPQNANNTLYMTEQNLTVTYTAEDFFTNTATCQLQYTLTDDTPPQITCIAQDAVTLYTPGDTYTYNVTVGIQIRATDNRDTNVTILIPDRIFTSSSGNLNQVYTITGTAQDSAGNTDMCLYQVIVQAAPCSPLSLPTPVYGDKNCTSLGNRNYRCDLSCNPGYVFYDHQADATWSLTCTPSQAWPEVIPACIADTVSPVLTCPPSKSVYLVDENSIITIIPKEADFMFNDNSGQVTLTIPTSQFNITANNLRQAFRVSANARDENGNQVTCSYQILAEAATCSPLSLATPLHGKKNCSATGNGYACDLYCDAGYEFHERSELVVRSTCTHGNPWSIELPACASNVNKQSANYTLVFEYQYKYNSSNLVADLSCADIYRNGFNTKGLLQGSASKLASPCQNNFNADLRINMPFDQLQLRINQGSPNGSVQFTVSVNFTVQIYSASSAVPSWALSSCRSNVVNTVKAQNILNISTFISDVSQCPSLEANFMTYNVTVHFNDLLCPLGTVQSKIDPNNCLYCPEGYRTTGVRSCEKCGLGEYQDVINSMTCKVCADFKTTSSVGTVSSNQCYGDCNVGLASTSGFGPCNECPRNTYYVNRTYCEPCPSGSITLQSAASGPSYCISQSNLQLRCPMGTYQSNPGICSLCPRGMYQNNEGSISCISCGPMFSTYAMGSNSIAACVAMCSEGFISDSGVPPCRQCPRNTYWINSTYCSPCPNGGITLRTGATSSQLCLSQCPAGYFSYNGYGDSVTCQTCPLHHYQPGLGQILCIECANGQYTDGIGKTNLTDCKDAATNLCTGNTCRNGGNCTIQFHDYYCLCPKGYYGRNCEFEVNLCLSQPCFNNGICRSAPSGYNCTCPTGTNGSRCENIENKCSQGTRCFNGGYCVNDFNEPGGYRCICLSGFGGANCSQHQSVCVNQPCQNGGQCVDVSGGLNLRRKCICQSGFTGRNCETNINECESNPCLYGATCVDLVNGYRCTCRSSLYNGTNCETRRSPCQNVDCGSGTCVDDYYTDTYRCICNPGYYFGNACDYKIYLGKIVPDISRLPATPSNATSCRGTCDTQPACQGFSLKGGNCTLLDTSYTEGSLQTNSDYNTYLKSCLRPTDDYFTPWYDVDDPGADFSDIETLSVLRNVYGLTVCGATDPVNTECRNKNNSVPYPGCSASGVSCMGNSTNPCADYEVRFQCAVDRVFSDNICYAKDYCEDGNPCMNGGTCVDQAIGYHCNCPVGYTGLKCQTNINDCTNTSCLNGGVCIDGVNTFTCNCTNAYQGQICQTLINYCSINNRCNFTNTRNCAPVENDHICECYPGYEGQFCEINIDECASQPCYHGGTCKDGINQYVCDCTAGWTGANCNQLKQLCDPQSPCVGQAMCRNIFDDFYCECPASTYGKLCENTPNPCRDYNKCQNSATCSVLLGNMTCTCPNAGFMGDGCHVLTDLCGKTNYCQNGATCYTTQTGYGCTCPNGYVGTNCERNFDDCASSPCPLDATCIDDIGQYYCRCPLGKAGEQCSRTLDTNYDLYFYMPSEDGLAAIPYPIAVGNTTGLAVSLWVRYAVPGDDGPFFGFWSGETTTAAIPVLGLNDYGLLLFRENMTTDMSIPFKYNLKPNDGNWHNLVISYDSTRREYSLIVDTIKHGAQVVLQAPKLSGMWITLGCYGNLQTMKCKDKAGFRGYISQVNVYNRPLDFVNEIPQLLNKPQIVFIPGSILQWNEYSLIHGVRQVIPSAASLRSCQDPLSTSCLTRADREAPVIQNCPQDIVVYSDTRLKTVSWTEPTITGAKTTEISHRSGGTYTWGVYNVTYVAKDDNGNAAICTFKIYVQALKGGLDNPDLGYQNCWTSGNFLACSIGCNSSLSIDRYAPKYFSRGPSGSFNVDDKLFQKPRYPPCGKQMSNAKARVSVKLVYKIVTTYCLGVKQALTDRLYGALSGAHGPNAIMNMKLCKQANCKDVNIVITCGSGSGRRRRQSLQTDIIVQLTFSESDPSTADGSLTVEEVLTNQIMGTDMFNFSDTLPNGSMDNNGFDISVVSICPQGQTEINGFCVLCGAGTYFTYYTSENISGYCENCPLGQYQNQSGQSTCLSCSVPGSTTQTTGSTSATDCHASCSADYYFDISMNSCLPCPIGRYQDKTGQFYCEWCPVGKTTHGINSTSLSECFETCKSGQELNADGVCVSCEIGYYRNDTDSSTCQPCPPGFITNSNGTVSLSDCNIVSCLAGSKRNVTSNTCTPCEKGTYQPDKWMTECISCGPTDRWTTDSTGSANESLCRFYCPSGYEAMDLKECKICPVGTYKDNTVNIFGVCTDCPVGMTSPTNGSTSLRNCSIHQCPAGYKNNANKTGCIMCPLGTYQPLVDQLDCMTCPVNLSTRQEGSNSSTACETYCPSGQEKVGDMCIQCLIGYYKDNNESLFGTCQRCPDNYVTPSSNRTALALCIIRNCTAGTKRNANDTACEDCPLNMYQPDPYQTSCINCSANTGTRQIRSTNASQCETFCASGFEKTSTGCQPCQRGYYKDNNIGLFSVCTICPMDFITSGMNATSAAQCIIGNCSAGNFINPSNNSQCLPCAKGYYQPNKWSTSCIQCDTDKTTERNASTIITDCILVCPPGKEDTGLGSCAPCQRGFYKSEYIAAKCTACPSQTTTVGEGANSSSSCSLPACEPGQYLDVAKNICSLCDYDKYQDKFWMELCVNCSAGYVTLKTGATGLSDCVLDCSSGSEYVASSKICRLCPRGSYRNRDDRNQTSCIMCPSSQITAQEGSGDVSQCNIANCTMPGQYRDSSSNTCKLCPIGTYVTERWRDTCDQCISGYTTQNTGSTSSSDCKYDCASGSSVNAANMCQLCPVGTYRTREATWTCQLCPNGTKTASDGSTSVNACNMSLCQLGQGYINQTCQPCPKGQYQPQAGKFDCISCPANRLYTLQTGATSITDCKSGCSVGQQFVPPSTCQNCSRGTYQDLYNEFNCKSCPANRPYTAREGAVNINDCISRCNGSNDCSSNGTCTDVPSSTNGYTCACQRNYADTGVPKGLLPGRECVHSCDHGYCQNNAVCEEQGESLKCICSTWYEGELCQTRVDAQTKSEKFNDTIIGAVVGVVVGLLIIIVIIVACLVWARSRGRTKLNKTQFTNFQPEFIHMDKMSLAGSQMYEFNGQYPYTGSQRPTLGQSREVVYDNRMFAPESENMSDAVYIAPGTQSYYEA